MAFWNTSTSTSTNPRSDTNPRSERPADAAPPREPQSNPAPAQPARGSEESTPMAMMKREEVPAGATPVAGDLLLGHGAEFEGKLTFAGTVRIDAKFKGSIVTNDVLVVGENARIDADITCGTVIVHGEVNGNVKAKNAVELRRPAKLRGNVTTPSLMIEKGVLFQGESRMGDAEKVAPVRAAPGIASGAAAAPHVG